MILEKGRVFGTTLHNTVRLEKFLFPLGLMIFYVGFVIWSPKQIKALISEQMAKKDKVSDAITGTHTTPRRNDIKRKKPSEDILATYKAAQQSAEHHNQMVWILTPILVGFVFFLISNFNEISIPFLDKAGIVLICAVVLFYHQILAFQAKEQKLLKYSICQKIEEEFRVIQQHRSSKELADGQSTSGRARKAANEIIAWSPLFLFIAFALWLIVDEVFNTPWTKVSVLLADVLLGSLWFFRFLDHRNSESKISRIVEKLEISSDHT